MIVSSLVVALWVAAGGGSGGADDLVTVERAPLKMKIPAAWKVLEVEGSQRYSAPSGDAYFLLDVGSTARPMSGAECREKILTAMGVEDAQMLTIGKSPAAKQVAMDKSPDGKGEVQTTTFIGCDGKTTWSLVFHIVGKRTKQYAPLADKIAKSVEYL